MKVLIIGAGGREHALVRALARSKKVSQVYAAPGSSGMVEAQSVAIAVDDVSGLVRFAQEQKIALTIVGPELPLTLGVVDAFGKAGLKIFGPTQAASVLEASKTFTKAFCLRHGIPTATYHECHDFTVAQQKLQANEKYPVVIKADGLAAGKGVFIARHFQEGEQFLADVFLNDRFGAAGARVIIEEFLVGEECSFIVLADGESFVEFPVSQDHKAVFDQDQGPNTGGMGAYAPASVLTSAQMQMVRDQIIKPTLKGMAQEGHPYTGVLYAGLMVTADGPQLLEYNCRFGDPEAEVLLPLLKSDAFELFMAAVDGRLNQFHPEFESGAQVCVVLASGGYPGDFKKGLPITGLEAKVNQHCQVFHGGTKLDQGQWFTNGGRVLVVSAWGENLTQAVERCYGQCAQIHWPSMHHRKDIAAKGLRRQKRDFYE